MCSGHGHESEWPSQAREPDQMANPFEKKVEQLRDFGTHLGCVPNLAEASSRGADVPRLEREATSMRRSDPGVRPAPWDWEVDHR